MAKKNGNGEGSIYPHKKNGKKVGYRGAYWVQTAEGPKRRYVSGKTREEVRHKLTKAMADRDGGLIFDAGNLTLGEYLKKWLDGAVRDTVKQNAWENYEYVSRVHLIPALGSLKLKAITPAHVQVLYRSKLNSGLSGRTVKLIHTVLNKSLKYAVHHGLIPRNSCESVTPPRVMKKEIKALSPQEAKRLLESAKGERFEALYVLAITAGLREGELLGLRWQDVNLDAETLSVRQQLTRTRSGLSFTSPKGDKSRSIRLASHTVRVLKHHNIAQKEERLKAGSLWQDTRLVFTTKVGTPVDVGNLTYRSFRPLLERAGLPRIRVHDLRHTFATLLLSKGTHPKIVQEMLGHANISMTLDTYSHVLPTMQDEAIAALEGALT
jgi:integrase